MRNSYDVAILAVALATPGLARAETPPDNLFGGEVGQAISSLNLNSSCYVNRGFSSFQRNGLGSKAVISFSEITDSGVDLNGQAVMTFKTATSGDIRFKRTAAGLPAGTVDPPFVDYAQTYNASALQLVVKFTINFSDCSLPISATYDAT